MKNKRVFMNALAHPIALGALIAWLLNDHLLKDLYPGVITGKLSDIAGMIVTPIVVAVVAELALPSFVRSKVRFVCITARLSALSVAALLAAVKTWAPANEAYSSIATLSRVPLHAVLSRLHETAFTEHVVLVRDVTDLIAIPFGVVAVWLLEQTRQEQKAEQAHVRAPELDSIPSDA